MTLETAEELAASRCRPCQALPDRYTPAEAQQHLASLAGWRLTADLQRIRKDWEVKDFAAGVEFFRKVAELAEAEGHHPDLHLEGYRHVWIELWTHSVGGLSENDFILAAKIDRLPFEMRKLTAER